MLLNQVRNFNVQLNLAGEQSLYEDHALAIPFESGVIVIATSDKSPRRQNLRL
jgi:hypothetical protein